MPPPRRSDQAQRWDLIGVPAVEVHGLRRVDDGEVRRHGDEAGRVPRVAPLQGLPGGDAGRRAVLQAQDGRVLGGLAHDRGRGELAAEDRPAQPPGADVGQAREGDVLVVPRALGGREDGAREARRDADRRGHRHTVQRLLRLAVARGRRAGVGRQGRVGGPPPQGPVPVLAGLMDGNGCSIGTHILSYKPSFFIRFKSWAKSMRFLKQQNNPLIKIN